MRSFHTIFLSRNLRQMVRRATNREGGCLLPGDVCIKNGRPVADVLWEKHPYMCVLPVENSTCAAFEDYKEVLETVPLDLSEDNVTWVSSKLSGCAIEMINWLLRFGCVSEEFRVIFLNIADCRENYSLT